MSCCFHSVRFPLLAVALAVTSVSYSPPLNAQENRDRQSDSNEHQEDEVPALGVVVDSAPHGAVLVLDTVQGCPAGECGITHGDYILSVDGKKIQSPKQLRQLVEDMEPGSEVSVTIWRQGQETNKNVTLASRADQPPASDKAWLGVMLSPAQDQGVRIERVVPGSPADEAGLRRGDVIQKQADQEVADLQSFMQSVEDAGPDSELQLTVKRNDEQVNKSVKLGHFDDAPMRFLRQALQPSMGESQGDSGRRGGDSSMTDQTLDQMRQRIRSLERKVRQLTGEREENQSDSTRDDVSQATPEAESGQVLVVQRDGRRGSRGRDRDWDRNDRRRGWDNDDWRNRYRQNDRRPLYQSPRYGNRYYQYRGRPYYYGSPNRGYGYGRSGIQFGNLGVYWY